MRDLYRKRMRTGATRVGDHRVLCQVRGEVMIVLVVEIGHRREIYRRPPIAATFPPSPTVTDSIAVPPATITGMRADPATEAAVKAVLEALADVYAARDSRLLRGVFAPDPDVVMVTPGAAAVVGLAAIEAKAESDWSRSEAGSLAYGGMSISAAGPVAWAVTDADFSVKAGGLERALPLRITFVLERRGERWLIMHAHYSLADA